MSSAHYFFKNYDIKTVINLICYMTEFPHTLTSTQKITRLYRYAPLHPDASSAGKENGPSTKIAAIPTTTIAISPTRALASKLSSPSLKVQPSSGKPWSILKSESGRTWIRRC